MSDSIFEFNSKTYTVETILTSCQKQDYALDCTVLMPEPLCDITQLSLPVGEHADKKNIVLVAPSFISTLHYAAALKKQYPSVPLNLVVIDHCPFVLDCWDVIKNLLRAANNADNNANLKNDDIAERFLTFLQKKVNKKFKQYGYAASDVQSRDPHDFLMQHNRAGIIASVLKLLDSYGVKLLSDVVSNAVFFCGDYSFAANAETLSQLIKNNPQSFSLFYASNVFEIMHVQLQSPVFKMMSALLDKDTNKFLNDNLAALLLPVYNLSVHLYTRRSNITLLQAFAMNVRYRVDQTCPNKILIAWGDSNMSVRLILEKHLDTLFFQSFYPLYPTTNNIVDRRPEELQDVCVLRDKKITALGLVSSAPSLSQNRHACFSAQAVQSTSGATGVPPGSVATAAAPSPL